MTTTTFKNWFLITANNNFFSNETGSKSMTTVIRETNSEVYQKIEDIKKKNKYDEVNIDF